MAHQIEKNDSLFSVKETPWHGLGTVLDGAPSIDEALTASGLDWEVKTIPVFAQLPKDQWEEFSRTKLPLPNYRAIQRVDTQEVFGVLSDKYIPLQNKQAFSVFRPLVESGELELETAGSLLNGRKTWILAKVPGIKPVTIRKGDQVKPYVLLSNSHDGSNAVRFGVTPIRVVCNNTLSMAHGNKSSELIKVYHRGDVTGNLDQLRDMVNVEMTEFQATMKEYKKLASKEISQADMIKYIRMVFPPKVETSEIQAEIPAVDENFLDAVINATPDMETLSRKEEAIIRILEGGRGSQSGRKEITYWDAYNAVNEWGLYERGYNEETRLASSWFGNQKADDQKALNVAIKLAAA